MAGVWIGVAAMERLEPSESGRAQHAQDGWSQEEWLAWLSRGGEAPEHAGTGLRASLARSPGAPSLSGALQAWAGAVPGLASALLKAEEERLLLWGPVAVVVGAGLGCGVLADLPVWMAWMAAAMLAAIGLGAQLRALTRDSVFWLALGMLALAGAGLASGVAVARMKTDAVNAPRIEGEGIAGAVTGTVVNLDRSQSGRWRLTLAVREIESLAPDDLPARVRLSLVSGVWGAAADDAAVSIPALGAAARLSRG